MTDKDVKEEEEKEDINLFPITDLPPRALARVLTVGTVHKANLKAVHLAQSAMRDSC